MAGHIDLFRKIIDRGFNGGDLSVADEICSPALVEHQYLAGMNESGAAILKQQIQGARASVAGLTLSIEQYHETGDSIWVRMRATGTAQGHEVAFDVFDLCRFKDGKLVEHWGVPDRFAMLHQAGLLPPR